MPPNERYLGIQIFRFYIRCTRCSAEIVFRTDPKNQDYVVERGAKRNTEPWKRGLDGNGGEEEETDEQRLDRLEREMAEREAADNPSSSLLLDRERDAMAELEAKTADAKREMAVADALDEIRSRNARLERAQREGAALGDGLAAAGLLLSAEEERRRREEEEDAEAARRAFAFARRQEMLEEEVVVEVMDGDGAGIVDGATATTTTTDGAGSGSSSDSKPASPLPVTAQLEAPLAAPPPSFKRQVKKKKDHAALLGIKKKQPLV